MRASVLLVAMFLTGCAVSGTSDGRPKGSACVEQPKCTLMCIVRNVECPKESDRDGA